MAEDGFYERDHHDLGKAWYCTKCGAQVREAQQDMHTVWHYQITPAVLGSPS